MSGLPDFAGLQGVASKYGQKRLLSDRTRIFVKSEGKIVRVGEFDTFSVTHRDSVRTFKPVGETREIAILQEAGYDLSFSGGKVDWNLARLLHKQELFYNTRKPGEGKGIASTFGDFSVLPQNDIHYKVSHVAPKFEVEHTIFHYNGSIETYIYEDVTLYGYQIDVNGDLEQIRESVKGHSPRKTRSGSTFIVEEALNPGPFFVVENIISNLLETNYNNKISEE